VRQRKKVHCWGDNFYGQLGYGDTENIGDDEAVSARGAVQVGGDVIQIVAGAFHTCALLDDGRSVKCWGNNQFGQLGYGNTFTIGDDETPAAVGVVQATTGGERITKLVAGFYHTCAQLNELSIRCWGAGDSGQLGYGTTDHVGDTETPASRPAVPLADFSRIDIVAGGFHTCALIDNDTNPNNPGPSSSAGAKAPLARLVMPTPSSVTFLSPSQSEFPSTASQPLSLPAYTTRALS
jgi:alpha-tubulin suppressor-like RCC1 family protein